MSEYKSVKLHPSTNKLLGQVKAKLQLDNLGKNITDDFAISESFKSFLSGASKDGTKKKNTTGRNTIS